MSIELLNATLETLYMVLVSTLLTFIIGGLLGVVLYLTKVSHCRATRTFYSALSFVVNFGRSIPYIILMLAISPLTRLIVGTSIGTHAAIVPLTLAAIPLMARLIQGTLEEVDPGLTEASLSMGATNYQLMFYVLLPEARTEIIRAVALVNINLIGYSAMAGAIGGGGLGTLAVNYGHQRFDVGVMISTICILVIITQFIQVGADRVVARLYQSQRK